MVTILWRVHTQLDSDTQIVITQKSSTSEKWRAGCERAQTFRLTGADLRCRVCAAEEVDEAVGLDARYLRELALELVCSAQRRGAQRVRSLEHDYGLIALGK